MEVLRASEASAYLDGIRDDVERSAVLAIHLTWLDNCSSLAKTDRLAPDTPIDMLLMYRAAANTFREPLAGVSGHSLVSDSGKVVNRDEATQRLASVTNTQKAQYSQRFLGEIIKLSNEASCEQDLLFFLKLYLLCLDRCTIDSITSGEISKASRLLADPDFW